MSKSSGSDGTTIFADRASALNHGQELTFEGHVRDKHRSADRPKRRGECKKDKSMKLPSRLPGWLAAIAAALLCSSGAGAAAAEKPSRPQRLSRNLPWDKFKGADLDRRGQARLLRQGTQGSLFRQRRRHSGRHENDLHGDDCFSGPRPGAGCCHATAPPKQTNGQSGPTADSGVKRLEATGPVTVISKTQVATGDNGSLRQSGRQSMADWPCHAQRRPERHQRRQADL